MTNPETKQGDLGEQARVTGTRNFSGKLSQSRNGPIEQGDVWRQARAANGTASVTNGKFFADELWDTRNDPDSCRHCGWPFSSGRIRFVIMTGIRHGGGWGIASVCMDCFKCATEDETTRLTRHQRECAGCREPMLTPLYGPFRWQVCSHRCYQRCYRKRRRGRRSVVAYKGFSNDCESCQQPLHSRRRDARFCCNACRQRQYRARRAEVAP